MRSVVSATVEHGTIDGAIGNHDATMRQRLSGVDGSFVDRECGFVNGFG
jgi:hypothetical protein